MAKHTPGPWQTVPDFPFNVYAPDPGSGPHSKQLVAHCDINSLQLQTWRDDESRANVALIAAAPDLLASLREMVAAFWGDWDREDWRASFRKHYPNHIIVKAEAAIAKAQGEKP